MAKIKKLNEIETLVETLNTIAPHKLGYRYYAEFASCYGGYRLVSVNPVGGGHSGAFGQSDCCSRVPKKAFLLYLNGLISGIEAGRK